MVFALGLGVRPLCKRVGGSAGEMHGAEERVRGHVPAVQCFALESRCRVTGLLTLSFKIQDQHISEDS